MLLSPEKGTGKVALDHVPKGKNTESKYKWYLHFYSSLPIHHWCKHLQKVLISKSLFPSLSKENGFQMFEKDREPCDFPIKGPIQPTWQPPPVPGLETVRLLRCHFVRLVGKWRSCCQMDYCTILVPKRDVKSCRVVACCSRKKIVSFCNEFTHTAQNAKTLIFQQRNAK